MELAAPAGLLSDGGGLDIPRPVTALLLTPERSTTTGREGLTRTELVTQADSGTLPGAPGHCQRTPLQQTRMRSRPTRSSPCWVASWAGLSEVAAVYRATPPTGGILLAQREKQQRSSHHRDQSVLVAAQCARSAACPAPSSTQTMLSAVPFSSTQSPHCPALIQKVQTRY